ncbi:MAG: DUF2306 domain-containing protein [Devosia sp.]
MSTIAATARPSGGWTAADWLIPAGLLALAFIPVVAGAFRVTALIGHAEITVDNIRFFASPIPVLLHIVSVTLYSVVGAFQFSPGIRRRFGAWHRRAGRILVGAGLVAALSGLWMATFYAIVPADHPLLHALRLLFGSAMAISIILGFSAIRRGNVAVHQAWMRRAYAIGLGAGTQGLVQIPQVMIFGKPDSITLALLMGSAWILNLSVAEWLIRRQRRRLPPRTS